MNQLYLLGGPPRTAKSTIMAEVVRQKGIPLISTDAVQAGLRNVLINDPYQMLRGIDIQGTAEYKTSIEAGGERKPFSKKSDEADLTREIVLGMLDHYARQQSDVAMEGTIVTPEWAAELDVVEYSVCAAFVGYSSVHQADVILEYARAHPGDWIAEWLEIEQGDDIRIRAWVAKQVKASQQLETDAETAGYRFFDISKLPFDDYVSRAVAYFSNTSKSKA